MDEAVSPFLGILKDTTAFHYLPPSPNPELKVDTLLIVPSVTRRCA